jgi:hypothetical protein
VILEGDESNTPDPKAAAVPALVDASADSAFELSEPIDPSGHEASIMSKTTALLTRTSVHFLCLSRKTWLLRKSKASLTLATTPLDHHTTRSTNIMIAYQRSQGPILCLNRWTRSVEERVRKMLELQLPWPH